MHLRSIRNQRTEVSLYDPVGVDKEGNAVTLMDILGESEDTVHEKVELEEEKRILLEHLHVLDEKESYVLRLRYGLDGCHRLTQRQIAARLDISRSYVSRIEKKAIQKLRRAIEEA